MTATANACLVCTFSLVLFSTALRGQTLEASSVTYQFDIPSEDLQTALQAFVLACHHKLLYRAELVAGKKSHALTGTFTTEEAVRELLSGTGLEFEITPASVVLIKRKGEGKSRDTDEGIPSASTPGGPPSAHSSISPQGAPGQGASELQDQIQEIVVTATRREESLSKVPISITALTQNSMDALGIKDLADVVRFTPGLSILDSGNFVNVTIRGIGSSGGSATTGVYVDDTPIQERTLANSEGSQALPKTFDLDRVEVLRGPQGTLFGAGSEGGTVRYIMTQPSLTTFSSYARSELSFTEGGAPSYEAGMAAGGPLIDNELGVRASVWYRRDGGWIDRVDPTTFAPIENNNNHGETTSARIAATWAPTAAITVTPSVMYQDRKLHDLQNYWGTLSNPQSNRFVSADPSRAPEDDSYGIGSLKITADLGPAQLISNTSGFYREDLNSYDGTLSYLSFYQTLGWPPDGIPFAGPDCPTHAACYPFLDGSGVHLPPGLQDYRVRATLTSKQDAFTQEFRLQSKDVDAAVAWTVGTFFSVERTTSLEQDRDPGVDRFFGGVFGTTECNAFGLPCNANGSTPLVDGDTTYLGYQTGHDRQIAGFGEVVWTLADRLKLTTGLRYSKLGFDSTSYGNGPVNFGPSYTTGEEREHAVTERVGLAFQADPADLYYATFSTGFRPGGANAPIPQALCSADFNLFGISGAPLSYKSDTVRSFELGAKNNIDNRLKLATSIYYIRWNDIQQEVALPTCGNTYAANLGTAVSKGGDLDLMWAVVDSVTLDAAIGYTNAKYTKSVFAGPNAPTPLIEKGDAIVSGQGAFSQPLSPWTVSVGAQYDFHAFEHKSFARLDYEFASKNNSPFAGDDARTVQYDPYLGSTSSHAFMSARAGTEFNNFSLSFFIDNLLDSHTITSLAHTPLDGSGPQPPVSPLYTYTTFRPRSFGLTFVYRN
jgi:outer membrane receptor protein involved in Fe transport